MPVEPFPSPLSGYGFQTRDTFPDASDLLVTKDAWSGWGQVGKQTWALISLVVPLQSDGFHVAQTGWPFRAYPAPKGRAPSFRPVETGIVRFQVPAGRHGHPPPGKVGKVATWYSSVAEGVKKKNEGLGIEDRGQLSHLWRPALTIDTPRPPVL